MSRAPLERTVVLLIGAVQFVNILDFVMVAPLGPDFARALAIPESHLGWVVGAYSAAAALSGLVGAFFLDRFDRRKALAVSMAGLVLGTLAGGLATGFGTLLAARVLAGLFGGPATALCFSIVTDVVPPERRGRAMGTVMSAFSIASIVGMPFALRLALYGGWWMPFVGAGLLGAVVTAGAVFLLPPLTGHLQRGAGPEGLTGFTALLRRTDVQMAYALVAASMMGGFLVVPNISAYVQGNIGFPRSALDLLYLVGGIVSLLTLRTSGRMVDRYGSFRVGLVGAVVLLGALYFSFLRFDLVARVVPGWASALAAPLVGATSGVQMVVPVLLVFMGFFLAMGMRNVAITTLTSKVPRGPERARFMSLQSFVQHVAMSLGGFAASVALAAKPGGGLLGMERVAVLSMALTVLAPPLMWALESRLRQAQTPGDAAPLLRSSGTHGPSEGRAAEQGDGATAP
ncbi:MAG: MFS transporter [Myxococcaceae bacterium]|nr:MFS transporter [Myxococcaceae bacterium]MCI0669033.1 MFS transporter [Myxococcaceae bacterium]